MEFRKFENQYVIRLDKGEEVVSSLTRLCKQEKIALASVSAIGATNQVTVGLFDTVNKKYESRTLTGDMEITSLLGTVSLKDGETYLHLHINVADKEQHVFGGHLNEAYISATCEMIVTAINGKVERKLDESIGLNLYLFDK